MPRSNARTHRRTRGTVLAGVAALGLAGFAAPADAALTAVSPNTVPVGSGGVQLPQWYDDGSQQLTVCPAGELNCGAVPDYVPPGGEAFYNRAVAKIDGPSGQLATSVIAVEAAFDPVFTSTPVTFARIRSKITGAAPNSIYNVVEPFGTQTITTNAVGVGTTTDQVGCTIATAAGTCDFSLALGGGVGPWLRWDPAVPPAAPAGYLGDAATAHAITGSPLGTNYFEMTGPGIGTLHTDGFAVTGKVFDPTKPSFGATPVAFGGLRLGTSATQDAVIRNDGAVAMNVSDVTITGTNAADFQIVGTNGCLAGPIAPNTSCTVPVNFAPSATGSRTAALSVTSDAPGSPHTVALGGTGTQSVIGAAPLGVSYGSQFVGTTTAPRTVDISNTGTATLNVGTVTLGGSNAADYTLGVNSCSAAVVPGSSCHVDVFFTPGAAGVRNATLSVASDGGSASISLSGIGVAAPSSGGGTPAAGGGIPAAAGTPVAGGTPAAGIPAPAPPAGTAGSSARPALALKKLGFAPRVKQSKAQRQGLRFTMQLPDGTEIVRINIYRKTSTGLKLLSSGYKAPTAAGTYRVSQNHAALRRLLRKGSYQVQVTPGYSKSELGTTSKATFTVV